MKMKKLGALGVICGVGAAAAAWPVWSVVSTAGTATANQTRDTAPADAVPVPMQQPAHSLGCVVNLSKDDCGGVVEPGEIKVYGCPDIDCRTLTVTNAVYEARLTSSGGGCGLTCLGRCDDLGDSMDGTLVMKFDYTLRADSCCPYRGFWNGRWEYVTADGRIFQGVAHGTLGVGTNRAAECFETPDACERCYDVQFDGERWQIAMEGSFQGRDERGNLMNFTTDSTWHVKQDSSTTPFSEPFRVLGRYDGALFLNCN